MRVRGHRDRPDYHIGKAASPCRLRWRGHAFISPESLCLSYADEVALTINQGSISLRTCGSSAGTIP